MFFFVLHEKHQINYRSKNLFNTSTTNFCHRHVDSFELPLDGIEPPIYVSVPWPSWLRHVLDRYAKDHTNSTK